jgi:hypothetical protein
MTFTTAAPIHAQASWLCESVSRREIDEHEFRAAHGDVVERQHLCEVRAPDAVASIYQTIRDPTVEFWI